MSNAYASPWASLSLESLENLLEIFQIRSNEKFMRFNDCDEIFLKCKKRILTHQKLTCIAKLHFSSSTNDSWRSSNGTEKVNESRVESWQRMAKFVVTEKCQHWMIDGISFIMTHWRLFGLLEAFLLTFVCQTVKI